MRYSLKPLKVLVLTLLLVMVPVTIIWAIEPGDTYNPGIQTLPLDGPFAVDSTGTVISKYSSVGNLQVEVQDQTSIPFDVYFNKLNVAETTLASPVAIGDMTMDVTDATNFAVGTYVGIRSGTDPSRIYLGSVLAVAAPTITLDTPINFAYQAGAVVRPTSREMNVDGSVTPQVFEVALGSATQSITIDVTRILVTMTGAGAMDDGNFGDQSALTRGVVFRKVNDQYVNYWNIKTNGDFANIAFDATYTAKGPAGINSFRGRYTLSGPDKHGVVIRLDPGDALQMIVQDDLSGVASFRMVAAGHLVQP